MTGCLKPLVWVGSRGRRQGRERERERGGGGGWGNGERDTQRVKEATQ